MEKQKKVWGATEALLRTPLAELHRISARPGYHCSWHRHERKHNLFYVLSGELTIQTHTSGLRLDLQRAELTLRAGEWATVPPGVKHRFVTGAAACEALELYYLEPLSDDIVRDDVGGRN